MSIPPENFIVPLLTIAGSFIGAWLAARFGLRRFYDEKLWERKTEAYTAIFAALHDMRRRFDVHYDAEIEERSLDTQTKNKLWSDYKTAREILSKRLAAEVWLIPDDCADRIGKMIRVLEDDNPNWFEVLDTGFAEIEDTIKDLTKLV